jgi:tetratricopeptide (TPR) repeat protein
MDNSGELEWKRVAEVFARFGSTLTKTQYRESYGTGYRIVDNLILTANHIVAQNHDELLKCEVRFPPLKTWCEVKVAYSDSDLDIAVLSIVDQTHQDQKVDEIVPVKWGKLIGPDRIPCGAMGFPLAQKRGNQRDLEKLVGMIEPHSAVKRNKITIHIEGSVPLPRTNRESPWQGMSGSLLFNGPFAVGVITAHPEGFGPDRLEGVAASLFAVRPEFAEVVTGRKGVELDLHRVPIAPPPLTDIPYLIAELKADIDRQMHGRRKVQEEYELSGNTGEISDNLTESHDSQIKFAEGKILLLLQELALGWKIDTESVRRIPYPFKKVVGRTAVLGRLKRWLCSEDSPKLVVLGGLPGVGKTALAAQLALDPELQNRFPDGTLWVSLGRQVDVLTHLRRWAISLGIQPDVTARMNSPADIGDAIENAIDERRMLLVIDDAWGEETGAAFIVGGPNCGYVITTRLAKVMRSVGSPKISGNNYKRIQVKELKKEDGRKLLIEMAPELRKAKKETLEGLSQAVGGLPLGLTIMGYNLRGETYDSVRRMNAAIENLGRDAEQRLLQEDPELPDSTRSLLATIRISDEALGGPQSMHDVFYALSIFPAKPNSFSEKAAQYIASADTKVIDMLVDRGLLEWVEGDRYTLNSVIADYAREQLPEKSRYERRMITFFAQYAEDHNRDFGNLDLERINILTAAQAYHGENEALVRIARALVVKGYFEARGYTTESVELLEAAINEAAEMEQKEWRETAFLLCVKLGEGYANYLGNNDKALEAYEKSLKLALDLSYRRGIAKSLSLLGMIHIARREFDTAKDCLARAERFATKEKDTSVLSQVFEFQAHLEARIDNRKMARLLFQRSLREAERLKEEGKEESEEIDKRLFYALLNLWYIEILLRNFDATRSLEARALQVARASANPIWEAHVWENKGEEFNATGNRDDRKEAQKYFDKALKLYRQYGAIAKAKALIETMQNGEYVVKPDRT